MFNTAETISFRWIIIVMIYIGMIVLSLSAESFDNRAYTSPNMNMSTVQKEMVHLSIFELLQMNVYHSECFSQDNSRVIHMWNSLSLARSISAVIGWVLIGVSPSEDMLYYNLVKMDKYYLANN